MHRSEKSTFSWESMHPNPPNYLKIWTLVIIKPYTALEGRLGCFCKLVLYGALALTPFKVNKPYPLKELIISLGPSQLDLWSGSGAVWSGGYCSSANMARGLSDGRSLLSLIIRAVMICRQEAAGAMDCGRGSGGS